LLLQVWGDSALSCSGATVKALQVGDRCSAAVRGVFEVVEGGICSIGGSDRARANAVLHCAELSTRKRCTAHFFRTAPVASRTANVRDGFMKCVLSDDDALMVMMMKRVSVWILASDAAHALPGSEPFKHAVCVPAGVSVCLCAIRLQSGAPWLGDGRQEPFRADEGGEGEQDRRRADNLADAPAVHGRDKTGPSFRQSVHPSIRPSIHLSIRPSIHAFVHLSFRPSIRRSIRTSVHPSIHPSRRLSIPSSRSSLLRPFIHPCLAAYLLMQGLVFRAWDARLGGESSGFGSETDASSEYSKA
jgi:hypothetical protein